MQGREAGLSWSPTPEDLVLLSLLAEGHTLRAVARRLALSERTVRRRLHALTDELGVGSTIEAVVLAVREGHI